MSMLLLLVVLAGLGVACAWLLGAFVALVARHLLRGLRARWIPATLLAIPLAAAGIVTSIVAYGALPHAGCHCDEDPAEAVHLCASHPERARPLVLPASVVLILGSMAPARALVRLARRRRVIADLFRNARSSADVPGLLLAPLGGPNAFALAGGRIVADAPWWDSLQPAERAIVLAHERAHLARRDPQVLDALLVAASLMPLPGVRSLVRRWHAWAEIVADAAAARITGDAVPVAEMLLRQHAAAHAGAADLAPAFGDGHALEERISALLSPGLPVSASACDLTRWQVAALGCAAVLPLMADGLAHVFVETAVAVLR